MSGNQELVGWQSDSGSRNTLNIIENCLLTIFACTWSIQHLNVPRRHPRFWENLGTKLKWASFTILFPEFILAHAILELVMAGYGLSSLAEKKHVDAPWWYRYFWHFKSNASDPENGHRAQIPSEEDWTLTHIYFANMGGFYLVGNDHPDNKLESDKDGERHSIQEVSPVEDANLVQENTIQSPELLLTANHFAEFWGNFELPNFSEEDLEDKSKTDYFTKAIAILQISQLFLSLIVRRIRHFAFSQLETVTLAFAVCGVITYICYWYKPQDVGTPIAVKRKPGFEFPTNYQHRTFDTLSGVLTNRQQAKGDRIPNDNIPKYHQVTAHYALFVLAVLTAGFGSIHAIAWNFEFPTLVEKVLWRTATVISTLVPPLALLAIPLSQITKKWGDSDEFILTCLRVMREYCWKFTDDESVRLAMKSLAKSHDGIEIVKHYKEIFHPEDSNSDLNSPGHKLCKFIEDNKNSQVGTSLNLSEQFQEQLGKLMDILYKTESNLKLYEEARPELYPRRVSPLGQRMNQAIIYTSSAIYCVARLSIMALAFSSLRLMPESVYTTTWTGVIPSWA